MVDIAARLGVPVDYPTGRIVPKYAEKTLQQALTDGDITQSVFDKYLNAKSASGNASWTPDSTIRVRVGSEPETAHADFTGYGDADTQGKLVRSMAQIQLDLSRKYGDQFIDEAKKQEELANPQGTEARRLLASEINRLEDARANTARPVADTLDAQILAELKSGKGTAPDTDAAVANVLAQRAASGQGGSVGAGDINTELESGPAGQRRLNEREQKAMAYLTSGATPEDVDYRRRQQSMANMASFLRGQTPEAQFQQLSGGQQGAAPTAHAPGVVGSNPNIDQLGNQAGLQQANLATSGNANQATWFSGLSALLKGINVAGSAGFQPFAPS
jgi:hypothetical protein